MKKHYCDMCGKEYETEEDLVALVTGQDDVYEEILENAICGKCINEIKEFIQAAKIKHGV